VEPWQSFPDSDVFQGSDVVFVRISLSQLTLTTRLGMAVEHLRQIFAQESYRYPNDHQAIIAWGTGGLLVKTLLVEGAYPDIVPRLRLVVLIGTPGRKKPRFFEQLLPSFLILKELNSPGAWGFKMDELGSAWESFVRRKGIRVVSIVGADDLIAPYSAADQWDSRNVFIIPETHNSLASGAAIKNPDSSLSRILSKVLLEEARGPQMMALHP
jgi:hypothetical protein